MTPSNANTSGLEVVAKVVSAHGDPEAFGEREIEVVADLSRIPYRTDLVTAASAQARIDAAEVRADRLAKALENLVDSCLVKGPLGGDSTRIILAPGRSAIIQARAALQQEG